MITNDYFEWLDIVDYLVWEWAGIDMYKCGLRESVTLMMYMTNYTTGEAATSIIAYHDIHVGARQ